jgi:DUF1365 family protein
MKPQLLQASTYHRRIGGPSNAFRYTVDYVLSEPEARPKLPWLLSRNRFNLASINDRDHGGARGDGRGAVWVRDVLYAHQLDEIAGMRVLLLAQPRMLGHLFNPVSFWLIVDENDNLRAFIAEVNNTMGDRHSYLCHHPDLRPIRPEDVLSAQKVFHVSPFQKIGGGYKFNLGYSKDAISVRIDFRHEGAGLLATLAGKRKPLGSLALLGSALRRPAGSLRVVVLIHWQAIKLLAKGAPFRRRTPPPEAEVTQ